MNSNNLDKEKTKILDLFKQKKFEDVIKIGSKLYNTNSKNVQLIYILGLASINLKNFISAENYFKKFISIKQNSEGYYILGNIQKKLKKLNDAIISFENAIKLNSNFSEAYNNLGNTKKLIGRRDEAINDYKKAIFLKEKNIEALISLSIILKEDKKFEDLVKIYEKILIIDKNKIKTLYNLGAAHLFLGNFDKGRSYFEDVIKINKNHIPSFRNYVSITKIDNTNKIFKILENINLDTLSYEDKILAFNALSKGYFDIKNVEFGFKYLDKSNSLKKEKSKFSMKDQITEFNKIKNFFSSLENLKLNFDNNLKSIPIFIVGMPRSGTSLVEQILSSHSSIYGAGELNFLQKSINRLGLEKPANYDEYFSQIRNYYYEKLSKISKKAFIIDKLPINFKWIGFIVKSFPEAKIIHIERNPMAVCWSNYKTHFVDSGMDFNLSQEDVAKYYKLYSKLMIFWKEKFGDKILNINYENYVQNFEEKTKKILNLLDLNWEKQIKNYQNTNRAVTTASYQQVRGKIKKNTSKEWRKYDFYLKKMQATLNNENIEF